MYINIPKEELDRPIVDDGEYPARIGSITMRESTKGNKLLGIRWVITGTEPPAGQSVLDNITLIQEAYWKIGLLFQATGFTPEEKGFEANDLIGKECRIKVSHEEYEGITRNKVQAYMKL